MSCAPPALCLLLLAATALHGAEVTTSFSQTGTNTQINFLLTNNDPGAIYNSAELRLEATLAPVVDAILRYKPGYTTRAQVYAAISVTIQQPPSGEVYTGWSRSLSSSMGVISLTNFGGFPDFDYTTWQNTLANAAQDLMAITLNLGGLLDFDGDSQLDAAERLLTLPPLTAAPDEASAGFVGIEGLTRYTAAVNRFAVAGAWVERARAAAAHGVQRSGSDATLSWQALHGLGYTLQTSLTLSSNPADWTPLSTQQRTNNPGPELAPMTFTHPGAFTDARRFYRLLIEVPP